MHNLLGHPPEGGCQHGKQPRGLEKDAERIPDPPGKGDVIPEVCGWCLEGG